MKNPIVRAFLIMTITGSLCFLAGYGYGTGLSIGDPGRIDPGEPSAVTVPDPQQLTLEEVRQFLAEDKTDRIPPSYYNCLDYTFDVYQAARWAGIECYPVKLILGGVGTSAHAIVAFKTTDAGLVFFEPQSDQQVDVQVNGMYTGKRIVEVQYLRWGQ